jgi:hypothetical protein
MFYTVSHFRLVERFLLDGYKPHQLSTYALSLYRYQTKIEDETIIVGMPVCTIMLRVQEDIKVIPGLS